MTLWPKSTWARIALVTLAVIALLPVIRIVVLWLTAFVYALITNPPASS